MIGGGGGGGGGGWRGEACLQGNRLGKKSLYTVNGKKIPIDGKIITANQVEWEKNRCKEKIPHPSPFTFVMVHLLTLSSPPSFYNISINYVDWLSEKEN